MQVLVAFRYCNLHAGSAAVLVQQSLQQLHIQEQQQLSHTSSLYNKSCTASLAAATPPGSNQQQGNNIIHWEVRRLTPPLPVLQSILAMNCSKKPATAQQLQQLRAVSTEDVKMH
jgi:hypothetical protein